MDYRSLPEGYPPPTSEPKGYPSPAPGYPPKGYPPPTSVPAGYPPSGYPPNGYPPWNTVQQPVYPPFGYPAPTRYLYQQARYSPGGYGYPPLPRPPKRSQGMGMAGFGSVVMAGLLGGDFLGLGGSTFNPAEYNYSGYGSVAGAFPYDVNAYNGAYDYGGGTGAYDGGYALGGESLGSFPFLS